MVGIMLVAESECHTPFQGSWTLGYHFLDSSESWCAGRLEDYSLPAHVFLPALGSVVVSVCINQRPGLHLVETVAICTWTEIQLPTAGTHAQQWLEYYARSSGTWSLSGGGLLQVGLSRNVTAHKHLKERDAICSVFPFCVLWTGWVLGTYLEVSLSLSWTNSELEINRSWPKM